MYEIIATKTAVADPFQVIAHESCCELSETKFVFHKRRRFLIKSQSPTIFTANEKVRIDNRSFAKFEWNPTKIQRSHKAYPVLIIFCWFGTAVTFKKRLKIKSELRKTFVDVNLFQLYKNVWRVLFGLSILTCLGIQNCNNNVICYRKGFKFLKTVKNVDASKLILN